MRNRSFAITLVCAFVTLALLAGCLPQTAQNAVDDAVNTLNKAIDTLKQQSTDWQALLKDTRDKLIKEGQSTIANEVQNALSTAIHDLGTETRCDVDFFRERVREDLIRIRAELTHEKLTLSPAFCGPVPDVIDMNLSPERRNHISIFGYNLDVAKIQVFLLDNKNHKTNVTDELATASQYLMTVNLGHNGVPLAASSDKLIFALPSGSQYAVNVIQPVPPTRTPEPVTITSLLFKYWTGDEDKDDGGGHVGAQVKLTDGTIIANGTTEGTSDPNTVWKDETTHGPFSLKLTKPVAWPQADNVRVAIWHRRDDGDPAWRFRVQIDAVLSNGQTRRVLDFYDPTAQFNHKPGDKHWWSFDLRGKKGEKLETPFFPLNVATQ